jgi:S-adenosylmethionine-diacylgycerolhomoserine-N-methlytransferase
MLSTADARVLWALVRGRSSAATHAQRLQDFYAAQASRYDAFRERLLQGRQELIERLPAGPGARVTELGAGTGRNIEFFGERLARLRSIDLVDLCPALIEQALRRSHRLAASGASNISVVHADATTYRPSGPRDCVYFSYALTMIPDWVCAIDNAIAMLRPGGVLGVVDFHLPGRVPALDAFWRRWFAHDGVWLSDRHLPYLRRRLRPLFAREGQARLPFLPGLRAPYYLYIGQKAAAGATGGATGG